MKSFVMLCCLGLLSQVLVGNAQSVIPLPMERIAPGVYVHHGVHEDIDEGYHGDICNLSFVIGEQGVAVIDTGGSPAVGRRLLAAIRQRTHLPILYVINTHIHPDHLMGNSVFKTEGARFVGHAKLPAAMAQRREGYLRNQVRWVGAEAAEGSELVAPDTVVADTLNLELGGRSLRLQAYPTSHTNTDITVVDSQTHTLWTGDLLFVERTPSIDGDVLQWLQTMQNLSGLQVEQTVPGHGAVQKDLAAALKRQADYFNALVADIRKSIATGGTMERTMDTAAAQEKAKWVLFDVVNRRNVNTVYPTLEWE